MIGNFISVDEACAVLHCSKAYLYQLIHRKAIPHYKPSHGRVLFDAEELDAFIRKSRISTNDELSKRATTLLNKRGS
jgi:excisionase family DNA binding protein